MKPKCLKSGKRMRKMLYFSGLLRDDEVVSFKAVYSFLRQNQNVLNGEKSFNNIERIFPLLERC